MTNIHTENNFNTDQINRSVNDITDFNIPINEITIQDKKYTKPININHVIEINKDKLLSALNPQNNLLAYPDFIFKFKKTRFFKFLIILRDFYRKIRLVVNSVSIIFWSTLIIFYILKLIEYKNHLKPTGFVLKKISLTVVQPNTFILTYKGIPLTCKNQTFDITNTAIAIKPLNKQNCWYKFASHSIISISTNTKETDLCFKAAINPKHSLSNICNEIRTEGCKIILQSTIFVTKFLIFNGTYNLTKEFLFKPEPAKANASGNELFYILNRALKGERVLFSEIKAEQLDILNFSLLNNREVYSNVVTPNMYFQGLKALSFDLPNLEFFYKSTKTNSYSKIKRLVLNDFKMVDGKLLPFKIIADDLPNQNNLSIEYLYLKLWEEQEAINLINVSIISFTIFEGSICLKQKDEKDKDKNLKEVVTFEIKKISPENINFTLSSLKTRQQVFLKQEGTIENTDILKIMTLDEDPLLLCDINYTFQSSDNLKNKQIEIQISNINWQLTLKGLKNGEEVQIFDTYDQHITNFSFKTFSLMKEKVTNQNKEGNEYNVNSWVQNISPNSFEVSCLLNGLLKNEELIKKEIKINFLKETTIKLSNDQLDLIFSIKKQTLIKHSDASTFNEEFKFKISVLPKMDFVGFSELRNLFVFELENEEEIDLQALSPRILDSKDIIGLFNHLDMEYSDGSVKVKVKETESLDEFQTVSKDTSSMNWILYLPVDCELSIPQKLLVSEIKIKSPEKLHICFTANRILFKSFELLIKLEPNDNEYQSDALKNSLLIFLDTHSYEQSINESLHCKTANKEVYKSTNPTYQEISVKKEEKSINEEKQNLLKELSKVLRKYNQIKDKIGYKMKPKIYIKFSEKERNSVVKIKATFENNSNINLFLKKIQNSVFSLNSHKYFSKSFSEDLQEKVFKKFMKDLLLLNNFPFEMKLNIKSIEMISQNGEPILELFIPNSFLNKFEIKEFEISLEVYLKNFSLFLEDNFLFEINIKDDEDKKSKLINSEASEGIFIHFLSFLKKIIKEKNNSCPPTNSNDDFTNEYLFDLQSIEPFLQYINKLPFFNLLHTQCEIYVEFLYENIFKFILLKQEESSKQKKEKNTLHLKIINNNLDLIFERFLSELIFHYDDIWSDSNTTSSTLSNFFAYVFNYGLEMLGAISFWNILNDISNIKITEEKYTKYQKIRIKQSFTEFKTEIIYTPNNTNFETKDYLTFVYKNTVLSFSLNFENNLIKNIGFKFSISKIQLENSNFNENIYIFKRLLSLYRRLFIKLNENGTFTETREEISLNFGQILKFYDSCGQYVVSQGLQKAKDYAKEKLNNCTEVVSSYWSAASNYFAGVKNWFMNRSS